MGYSILAYTFVQIPADGLVVSGQSLALDESSMTGESKIVSLKLQMFSKLLLPCFH